MAELYPLSKKEFETLYDKAWENGWVYGRFFQELYDEYLVNWVYFVDYLDVLKGASKKSRMYARVHDKFVIVYAKNQQPILIEAEDHYGSHIKNPKKLKAIEILIGEAPPYWKGNTKNKDKSYFYNPSQTKSSPWLNAPADWKSKDGKFIPEATALKYIKIEKLAFLASKGIVLMDIFPFPIIQDPKVRTEITGDYAYHFKHYFLKKYSEIIDYIDPTKKTKFSHGLVATELGALQFLCDESIFKLKGYSDIVTNQIKFNKFTCLDSWTKDIIDLNPNNKNKPCDLNLILHYDIYKEYHIPIVKYSTKNKKTDWSDKLKFVRKLLGNQNETIKNDQIKIILDHITKLPIFMKGRNVVFDMFINGTIE